MTDNVSRADVVAALRLACGCEETAGCAVCDHYADAIRALPAAPAAEACPTCGGSGASRYHIAGRECRHAFHRTPAPTVEAEEQAWDGDKSLRFTAVVFWNEVAWCAQLKEKDIASQGATVKEAFENLGWTIDADAKLHDGLARIAPCPGDVWREYARKAKRKRSRPIAAATTPAPTVEVDYDIEAAASMLATVVNECYRIGGGYSSNPAYPETRAGARAIVDVALRGRGEVVAEVREEAGADTKRLDFIQASSWGYGRGWVFRLSVNGRGVRLHETSRDDASPGVREAIDAAIRAKR